MTWFKKTLMLGSLALAGIMASCTTLQKPSGPYSDFPIGDYISVTESEWVVLMRLRENHTVRIELATWEAGEWHERSQEVYEGSWVFRGNTLKTKFDQGIVRFEYDPHLSFEEFAGVGSAPGFRRISGTFHPDWFSRSLYQKVKIDEIDW